VPTFSNSRVARTWLLAKASQCDEKQPFKESKEGALDEWWEQNEYGSWSDQSHPSGEFSRGPKPLRVAKVRKV
jgi:hypothetical protein